MRNILITGALISESSFKPVIDGIVYIDEVGKFYRFTSRLSREFAEDIKARSYVADDLVNTPGFDTLFLSMEYGTPLDHTTEGMSLDKIDELTDEDIWKLEDVFLNKSGLNSGNVNKRAKDLFISLRRDRLIEKIINKDGKS